MLVGCCRCGLFLLFSQLGITQSILEGTADEQTMNNYYERTIEPILAAIREELTRKFISKTARTQGKIVKTFNDPFRFVPTSKLPDLADKLLTNQIMTPNEFRAVIGYKPSDQPNADELRNPHLNKTDDEMGNVQNEELKVEGEEYLEGDENT